jgi:hypothetical protein
MNHLNAVNVFKLSHTSRNLCFHKIRNQNFVVFYFITVCYSAYRSPRLNFLTNTRRKFGIVNLPLIQKICIDSHITAQFA